MNATLSLIPTDQLDYIVKTLSEISFKLEALELSSSTSLVVQEEILTTKEAMSMLKIHHLDTFKAYLKRNAINSIDEVGPKRYRKTEVLKEKRRGG